VTVHGLHGVISTVSGIGNKVFSVLLVFTFSTKFRQENFPHSQKANIIGLTLVLH
jgi:hypothetical protein